LLVGPWVGVDSPEAGTGACVTACASVVAATEDAASVEISAAVPTVALTVVSSDDSMEVVEAVVETAAASVVAGVPGVDELALPPDAPDDSIKLIEVVVTAAFVVAGVPGVDAELALPPDT